MASQSAEVTERQNRSMALSLAHKQHEHRSTSATEIVADAQKYYEFMSGKTDRAHPDPAFQE